jgi:hypothetical protein
MWVSWGCLVLNLWVCWTKVKCGFRELLILGLWILVDKGKLWVSCLTLWEIGSWYLLLWR